jgi:hypothetical protein
MLNFDQDDDLCVSPLIKTAPTTLSTGAKQFKLTAKHAGLGVNVFIVEADGPKAAFSKFKSIVFSHKQWTVTSNEEIRAGGVIPRSRIHEEEDLI